MPCLEGFKTWKIRLSVLNTAPLCFVWLVWAFVCYSKMLETLPDLFALGRSTLLLSTARKQPSANQEASPQRTLALAVSPLTLWFADSQTGEIHFFLDCLIYSHVLKQPELTRLPKVGSISATTQVNSKNAKAFMNVIWTNYRKGIKC